MNKRTIWSILLINGLLASNALARETTWYQVAIWNPVQLFSEQYSIGGVRLNLPYGRNYSIKGVDLGFLNEITGDLDGVEVGFFVNWTEIVETEPVGTPGTTAPAVDMRKYKGIIGPPEFPLPPWKLTGAGTELSGVQVAGFANLADKINGIQIASLINLSAELRGIQISLIGNSFEDSMGGFQLALVNTGHGKVKGAQVGAANLVKGAVVGAQVSWLGNVAVQEMTGVQLSGIGIIGENYSKEVTGVQIALPALLGGNGAARLHGVQISATLLPIGLTDKPHDWFWSNVAAEATGVQIGLFGNYAGSMKGLQVGLVNCCETMQGVQIGLVNVIRDNPMPFFPLVHVSF